MLHTHVLTCLCFSIKFQGKRIHLKIVQYSTTDKLKGSTFHHWDRMKQEKKEDLTETYLLDVLCRLT